MDQRDICFDILDDLSEDLDIGDYFEFLTINDLTIELKSIIRVVEYYPTIYHALEDGDLDVIKWLKRYNKPEFEQLSFHHVCFSGTYEIIQWYHNNQINDYLNNYTVMAFAIDGNNLEAVRFLHDNGYVKSRYFWLDIISQGRTEIFVWAMMNELATVDGLHYGLMDVEEDKIRQIIATVIERDQPDMLKWLLCNGYYQIPDFLKLSWPSVEIIQLLYDNDVLYNGMMDLACLRGDLTVIRWLLRNGYDLTQNSWKYVIVGDRPDAIRFVHSHYRFPTIRMIDERVDGGMLSDDTREWLRDNGYIGWRRTILRWLYEHRYKMVVVYGIGLGLIHIVRNVVKMPF